jgi:hypothetical protein
MVNGPYIEIRKDVFLCEWCGEEHRARMGLS